jgi:hypothetical protein
MSNAQEKRVTRLAQAKEYRLEKVGKGPNHGRFCIVGSGTRMSSGITGSEFSFTLQEAEDWLAKHEKADQ